MHINEVHVNAKFEQRKNHVVAHGLIIPQEGLKSALGGGEKQGKIPANSSKMKKYGLFIRGQGGGGGDDLPEALRQI